MLNDLGLSVTLRQGIFNSKAETRIIANTHLRNNGITKCARAMHVARIFSGNYK